MKRKLLRDMITIRDLDLARQIYIKERIIDKLQGDKNDS